MTKELFVAHISDNATEEDVWKLFSVMGDVKSVRLIIDPETGEFKKCGYVRMAVDIDLKEVVETLDGALLIDRVISVSVARPKEPGKSGKFGRNGRPGGFATSDKSIQPAKSAGPGKYAKTDKPARSEKPAKQDKSAKPGSSTGPSRSVKPGSGRKTVKNTRPGR